MGQTDNYSAPRPATTPVVSRGQRRLGRYALRLLRWLRLARCRRYQEPRHRPARPLLDAHGYREKSASLPVFVGSRRDFQLVGGRKRHQEFIPQSPTHKRNTFSGSPVPPVPPPKPSVWPLSPSVALASPEAYQPPSEAVSALCQSPQALVLRHLARLCAEIVGGGSSAPQRG